MEEKHIAEGASRIHYIPVEKIPGMAAVLRAIKVDTFVKQFLDVQPISAAGNMWSSTGKYWMTEGWVPVKCLGPQLPAITVLEHKITYEHTLPMAPVECLSKMSEDVVAFEKSISLKFLSKLNSVIPTSHVIKKETRQECFRKAQNILENEFRPVTGLYCAPHAKLGVLQTHYFDGDAGHGKNFFFIISDKNHCGTMLTSQLIIDIKIDIPTLKLTLMKDLGFLFDPGAFIECYPQKEE